MTDIELVDVALQSILHAPNCRWHTEGITRCTCQRDEVLRAWTRIVERLKSGG